MSAKRRSQQELERMLLEDANNADAWGKPVQVPPSGSPRPAWYGRSRHLELAAKFLVLSVLHRLGSEATLTFAQPHNIDIAALLPTGEALTVDVKTLMGTRNWWVDQFEPRKHHFIAFVCFEEWDNPDPNVLPEIYMWRSESLHAFVSREKTKTVSLESVASKIDPEEAWQIFATAPAG